MSLSLVSATSDSHNDINMWDTLRKLKIHFFFDNVKPLRPRTSPLWRCFLFYTSPYIGCCKFNLLSVLHKTFFLRSGVESVKVFFCKCQTPDEGVWSLFQSVCTLCHRDLHMVDSQNKIQWFLWSCAFDIFSSIICIWIIVGVSTSILTSFTLFPPKVSEPLIWSLWLKSVVYICVFWFVMIDQIQTNFNT